MTEVVPLSSVYPNLQILWNLFLRHGCAPYLNQLGPAKRRSRVNHKALTYYLPVASQYTC